MVPPASVHELSILLVEPSPTQAHIIVGHLRSLGVRNVTVDHRGRAALARMRAEPPSLVLSAMYLPDMTGTELIVSIRMVPELAHTPFVLISSEERPKVLDPVRQSGVCAILPKPYGVAQLEAALRTALDTLTPDDTLEQAGLALEELRVLVVDDSALARRFIKRVLENLGMHEFVEATNGAEAAALLDQSAFDLVVTDYNMPEMDGRALVEHIRGSSWQNSVPILMVTSETDEQRLAAVHALGVVGVCDKPFEPAMVKQLLQQLMVA